MTGSCWLRWYATLMKDPINSKHEQIITFAFCTTMYIGIYRYGGGGHAILLTDPIKFSQVRYLTFHRQITVLRQSINSLTFLLLRVSKLVNVST